MIFLLTRDQTSKIGKKPNGFDLSAIVLLRSNVATGAHNMSMIKEFLVLSPRGDTLIQKNYSGSANRFVSD